MVAAERLQRIGLEEADQLGTPRHSQEVRAGSRDRVGVGELTTQRGGWQTVAGRRAADDLQIGLIVLADDVGGQADAREGAGDVARDALAQRVGGGGEAHAVRVRIVREQPARLVRLGVE